MIVLSVLIGALSKNDNNGDAMLEVVIDLTAYSFVSRSPRVIQGVLRSIQLQAA